MHRHYALLTLVITFSSYAMQPNTQNTQEKFIDRTDKNDICYVLDALDRNKTLLCAQDCAGRTALHRALLRNNPDIALILIKAAHEHYRELAQQLSPEYPLNIQDFEGNTPLHIAFEKKYTNLIHELCKADTNVTLANNNKITLIELLMQQHEQHLINAPQEKEKTQQEYIIRSTLCQALDNEDPCIKQLLACLEKNTELPLYNKP